MRLVTFGYRKDVENADEISDVLVRKRRRLSLRWLYEDRGIDNRTSRELFAFSTESDYLHIGAGFLAGLDKSHSKNGRPRK